jgi:hypothetical protein
MLRGGAPAHDKAAGKTEPFLHGVVCISSASRAGKTELVLEFADRRVEYIGPLGSRRGKAMRYLRESYLKLADHLGVAVGDNVLQTTSQRARSLHGIEGVAIAKIKKELTRDIPYLVVIDNLESERDWWDGRAIKELLPSAAAGAPSLGCH